jgi:hypothetical protein
MTKNANDSAISSSGLELAYSVTKLSASYSAVVSLPQNFFTNALRYEFDLRHHSEVS